MNLKAKLSESHSGRPVFGVLLALLACMNTSVAQTNEGWTGQLTPYLWGAGAEGVLRPFAGAPSLTVSKSFSDILGDLDAAFFATGLARKNQFVLLGDISHSSTSSDGSIPPGLPAEGDFTQSSVTVAAGQRVVANDDLTVDLLGGVRWWHVNGRASAPLVGLAASAKENFVDPILVGRVNLRLSSRWRLLAYGDFGGFDIGSKTTYQLAVTFNYGLGANTYLSGGYRYLFVDYEDSGTKFEGSVSGPIFGYTWRF